MLPKRIYAKINLDNIIKNVSAVRERIPDGTKILCVVKADGYGHGAVEISKVLAENGINDFGVATAEEALILRENSINNNILILGHVFPEGLPAVIKSNIHCTVSSLKDAEALSDAAMMLGKQAGIYLKLDVGMGRLGFQTDENSKNEIKKLFELPSISVLGAFAHFPCADTVDKTVTLLQKERFFNFTKCLIDEGFPLPCRHIYNSAAIMELEGDVGDMVRAGIMIYGLYPSKEISKDFCLFPALELKSSISFIKTVGADFTVGYGSTFTTCKETVIATVPVGYADGYPRYLSNKGHVLIKGCKAPIIGKICMDQFMIDITDIPNVKIGDEVTLIGTEGNETISVDDISDPTYRFNYETVCLINKRVPRVYVKDGKII